MHICGTWHTAHPIPILRFIGRMNRGTLNLTTVSCEPLLLLLPLPVHFVQRTTHMDGSEEEVHSVH